MRRRGAGSRRQQDAGSVLALVADGQDSPAAHPCQTRTEQLSVRQQPSSLRRAQPARAPRLVIRNAHASSPWPAPPGASAAATSSPRPTRPRTRPSRHRRRHVKVANARPRRRVLRMPPAPAPCSRAGVTHHWPSSKRARPHSLALNTGRRRPRPARSRAAAAAACARPLARYNDAAKPARRHAPLALKTIRRKQCRALPSPTPR